MTCTHLPYEEGLLVNHGRLYNLTAWEYPPCDSIDAGAGLIAVVVPLAGDCHVGKGRLLADGRLKRLELLWRHEKLDVRLLIYIPAHHRAQLSIILAAGMFTHDWTLQRRAHPSGPPQPTLGSAEAAALT